MPRQLSLFDDIGDPVPARQGRLFNEAPGGFQHVTGRIPGQDLGSMAQARVRGRQMSFDFSQPAPWASLPRPSMGKRALSALGKSVKAFGPLGYVLETAFALPVIAAGTITGAAQWGSATGLEEDYVGGSVYGATRGVGAGVGGSVGGIVGGIAGGTLGSFAGPLGTIVGATIGGIAGNIGGEIGGGSLLSGPGRALGLGARAIVRSQRATDRIQFGGSFVDSRAAYTMRQRAVQDMSGSMLNARQYLGNEALFLHR